MMKFRTRSKSSSGGGGNSGSDSSSFPTHIISRASEASMITSTATHSKSPEQSQQYLGPYSNPFPQSPRAETTPPVPSLSFTLSSVLEGKEIRVPDSPGEGMILYDTSDQEDTGESEEERQQQCQFRQQLRLRQYHLQHQQQLQQQPHARYRLGRSVERPLSSTLQNQKNGGFKQQRSRSTSRSQCGISPDLGCGFGNAEDTVLPPPPLCYLRILGCTNECSPQSKSQLQPSILDLSSRSPNRQQLLQHQHDHDKRDISGDSVHSDDLSLPHQQRKQLHALRVEQESRNIDPHTSTIASTALTASATTTTTTTSPDEILQSSSSSSSPSSPSPSSSPSPRADECVVKNTNGEKYNVEKIEKENDQHEKETKPQNQQQSSTEDHWDQPIRKSKMEKIRRLQAKNELYKKECLRLQADRVQLKKDVEIKNNEINTLTREIDLNRLETNQIKEQLAEAHRLIKQQSQQQQTRQQNFSSSSGGSNSIMENQTDESREVEFPGEIKELEFTAINVDLAADNAINVDLAAAVQKVLSLQQELDCMVESVKRKDEQIESLTMAITTLEASLVDVQNEKSGKTVPVVESSPEPRDPSPVFKSQGDFQQPHCDTMVISIKSDNDKQKDVKFTLEHAAAMMKVRDDIISGLLKDNNELKGMLSGTKITADEMANVAKKEIEQLQNELQKLNATLGVLQDRNLFLEEEMEVWLTRESKMKALLNQFNQDLEVWREKAHAAEKTILLLDSQVLDSKADAASTREALRDVEGRHRQELQQHKTQHDSEIKVLQARMIAERVDNRSTESPQATLLQQAVVERMKKVKSTSVWRNFLKTGDEDESLDDNQKKVEELESKNAQQREEIKSLKSDIVRLRSSHNESAYVSAKKIDLLSGENEAYKLKIESLERLITKNEDC